MSKEDMTRRRFIQAAGTATVAGLAGCNTGSDNTENTDTDTEGDGTPTGTGTSDNGEDQQTEADPENAVRYFFEDETGALGHLADDEIPENYDHTVTNSTTEAEYQEMQRNDRAYAEDAASSQTAPNGEGLDMTVDEMITRAEEIYNNPTAHLDTDRAETLGIDLTGEDDEIVFTRALIKASQEAGVDSSGLADIVVANIAEDAVEQIQPGFTDFKLSTLPATEAINPSRQGHAGGVRETEFGDEYGNSGFRHLTGLLVYEKNGETKTNYAEQIESVDATPTFFHAIRNPEDSIYRADMEQDTVNTTGGGNGIRFPDHYVTALDYTKARELESSEDNILGYIENDSGTISGFGDQVDSVLRQLVDDMGITGYNNNQDLNLDSARPDYGGTLVSDEFGESLEEFVTNPNSEKRQYLENIGRGLFQIRNQQGMDTSIALTGTLENPEILPTDQETVNSVRQDQAYDEIRQRILD